METLFSLANLYVMPFWALMIFLPRWRWTQRLMASLWPFVPLALLYAVWIVPALLGGAGADIANPTLAGIAALLGTPEGAAVGWVHFLAFDLFVGRWAYFDSQKVGLSPWLMAPILFLVLMAGPLGWLLYALARGIKTRDVWLVSES